MKKILNKIGIVKPILVLLGLTPILWFIGKGDVLINGVDTNFPLDPLLWFLRRLSVWNSVGNAGSDFSSSTAGLFFHFVQVVPHILGLPLKLVEIVSLVFWFSVIVWGAYLFVQSFIKRSRLAHLAFVMFYAFNIYLFNTWENVKVSNLSLVAAIPLALYIFNISLNPKTGLVKVSILTLIAGVILSGTGINPAYFISFFVTFGIYVLTTLIIVKQKRKTLLNFIYISSLLVFVNAFWILPTALFITGIIDPGTSLQSIGFTNWLDSLSQNTSLMNILRMQGAWDWYALDLASGMPLYIPYALNYFSRLPFLVYGFALTGVVFLSLAFRTKKYTRHYFAFGVMLVLGAFLGAGTHEPTGWLFEVLVEKMPFFSLFRSPWYIFTCLIVLSFSGLIGLIVTYIQRLRIVWLKYIFSAGLIVFLLGNFLYTYPLVTGKIFRPGRADSFFVQFPRYVFDAKDWIDKNITEARIIGYPDDELEQFTWGYKGVESILTLLTNAEVIYSPLNNILTGITSLSTEFYSSLKKGRVVNSLSLASVMGVEHVFFKADQPSLAPNLPQAISSLPKEEFGKWNFYQLPSTYQRQKIYATTRISTLDPYFNYPSLAARFNLDEIVIDAKDKVNSLLAEELVYSQTISTVFDQTIEDLQFTSVNTSVSNTTFDIKEPGSYTPTLSYYENSNLLDIDNGFLSVVINDVEAIWTVSSIDDSFITFEPVYLEPGKYTVSINFSGTNNYLVENFDTEIDGSLALQNKSTKDISKVYSINNFDPFSKYLVQVKYKHIYGNDPAILVNQKTLRGNLKTVVKELPASPEWASASFIFDPVASESLLDVAVIARGNENQLGTKVVYDELKVTKVFNSTLALTNTKSKSSIREIETAYSRLSSTSYAVDVKQEGLPHVLVFNENYSPNWEIHLYAKNGQELLLKPFHFKSNFYNNAWYIYGAPKEYTAVFKYSPQRVFQLGIIISIMTIGTALVFALVRINHKYAEH